MEWYNYSSNQIVMIIAILCKNRKKKNDLEVYAFKYNKKIVEPTEVQPQCLSSMTWLCQKQIVIR